MENCEKMGNNSGASQLPTRIEEFAVNGRNEIKQTMGNCVLALAIDEKLKSKFKFNLLTNKIDFVGDSWWAREGTELTDNDINNIRLYLEQAYTLTSEKGVPRAISVVAHQNCYHPIRDLLNSLHWDGKKRIENILPRFLGAEKNEYTTEAMKIFMLGAINRVFKPGCKFDLMLCLVGLLQGEGKSTLFRLLAIKDEWYSDDLKKLDDENVYRKMQGHWIIELAEMLATANAKSIEEIKSFISRQKETYKIPYETHPQDRPRQCILAGTTNNMDFLPKDRSGNRRFIPVLIDVTKAEKHPLEDEAETRQYLLDAWAEAMTIFISGSYSLTFDKKLSQYLKELQKEFMAEDTKAGVIQGWLDSCNEEFVCSLMLYREALEIPYGEPKKWEIKELNDIMNSSIEGWEKYPKSNNQKRFKGYGQQRAWQRIKKADDSGFVDINQQMEIPFNDL